MQQAKATVDVSRQDLQTVIVNRASLEADVANAEAALRLAQIDLDNTRIIAPEDGQLGQISVRRGAYVSAGTRLTSLVPGQKWVIANMKETQMANVRPGLPVTFTVDALNGATFHGVVEYISPAAGSEFSAISPDNATGNFVKSPSAFRCASKSTVRNRRACVPACRCRSALTLPPRRWRRSHDGAQTANHGAADPLLAGCATEVEKAPSSLPVPQQWRNRRARRRAGGKLVARLRRSRS